MRADGGAVSGGAHAAGVRDGPDGDGAAPAADPRAHQHAASQASAVVAVAAAIAAAAGLVVAGPFVFHAGGWRGGGLGDGGGSSRAEEACHLGVATDVLAGQQAKASVPPHLGHWDKLGIGASADFRMRTRGLAFSDIVTIHNLPKRMPSDFSFVAN
jgi:hypothetical protein